jgi:outer membrane protein assembly factor BamE
MKTVLIYTFSFFALFISGCAKDKIPGVYRIDIQQGNDITQDMISQLKSGMTKNQVAYVMGTPLIIDTFHPDRWDYIYSFHPGNGQREQRRITIYFKGESIDYINGDTRIVAREEMPQTVKVDSNVVVPLSDKKVGLIAGIKEKIGLEGDDTVEDAADKVDLFENRPIPVPRQSKGLIDRITGSTSAIETEETIQDVETDNKPGLLKRFIGLGKQETLYETDAVEMADIVEPESVLDEADTPGLFQRFKNAVGLGE